MGFFLRFKHKDRVKIQKEKFYLFLRPIITVEEGKTCQSKNLVIQFVIFSNLQIKKIRI